MAIQGLNSRDGIGLTVFVASGRQDEAAAFYRAAFGAVSPRHWINPKTGEVTGIDIAIGQATFTVCGANPKRDADPAVPGPCTPSAQGRGSTILSPAAAGSCSGKLSCPFRDFNANTTRPPPSNAETHQRNGRHGGPFPARARLESCRAGY